MLNQKDLPRSIKRTPQTQAKVMNMSAKAHGNIKIRLDRLFRSPEPRILIKRRLGGIGDVIMSTPLIKALKTLIPHCHITYATDTSYAQGALADVILHNPYVDELVQFGTVDESSFDYSVDITSTGLSREKSGQIPPNRIDLFAEEAGISIDNDPVPDYVLSEEEIVSGKELINSVVADLTRKIIVVQPRSNDMRRSWPAEHVNELCSMLSKDYSVIVLDWGHSIDSWFTNENCITLKNLDLNIAAAVIHHSDLIVCPDSSILHLAGALRKSIVTIFGPIPAICRINHYHDCVAIQLKLPCSNCFYTPRCKDSDKLTCLKKITPSMVHETIKNKLLGKIDIHQNIIYGRDLTEARQDNIILVKRSTPGLGDLLMAANGLEALKRKYPGKELHVATRPECFAALENNPHIDKLIDISKPINNKRYFIVIDISSPCAMYESSKVNAKVPVDKSRVEIYAIAMGARNLITDLLPRYYISEEEKVRAQELLKEHIDPAKKTIALTTLSAESYRNWPLEYTKELAASLSKKYNVINLCPGIELDAFNIKPEGFRDTSALLSLCDLLITVDTGPLHVAAALGVETIALFGPIDYKARCKGYKNITIVKAEMSCSPCWRNGVMKCKQTGKVQGYSKCLENILVKQVIEITKQKLQSQQSQK
jgi:ADP-heptose:LPS heptosyltransferase